MKRNIVLLLCAFFYVLPVQSVDKKEFEARLTQDLKVQISNSSLAKLHEASTLLVSCVDFRLRNETEDLMNETLGLVDDYDEVVFPGASLALVTDTHRHWGRSMEEIIALLEKLHHIKRVVFLDHRDCGAYKLIKNPKYNETKEKETAAHTQTLREAKALINQKFPRLDVYTLLLGLDGVVDKIQ